MYSNMSNMTFNVGARIRKISCYNLFFYTFICILMFVPSTYSGLRLALLIFLSLYSIAVRKIILRMENTGLRLLAVNLIYSISTYANSLFRGFSDGIIRIFFTDIIWPFLFILVFAGIKIEKSYVSAIKVLIAVECIICIYDLLYCFGNIGIVPQYQIFNHIDLDMHFGQYGRFFDFTSKHMVTHMYMCLFLTGLIIGRDIELILTRNWKRLAYFTYFLIIIVAIMSGRAAFQVIQVLSIAIIVITYFFDLLTKAKFRRRKFLISIIITIAMIAAIIFYFRVLDIDPKLIISFIQSKFAGTDVENAGTIREIQGHKLYEGWIKNPLLGNGAAAYVVDFIRADKFKFSYELTYLAMLFQRGIVGLLLFLMINIYSVFRIYKKVQKGYIPDCFGKALIYGMLSILLVNAVDPYLQKMGCIWMVYLPVYVGLCG